MALGVPPRKPIILAVDSNRSNLELLTHDLGQEGYDVQGAASLQELDEIIGKGKRPALALIDLSGFDESIWEHCDQLRKARVPFIVVSPQRSPAVQRESIKHGASGLLVKPLGTCELLDYIKTLLGD